MDGKIVITMLTLQLSNNQTKDDVTTVQRTKTKETEDGLPGQLYVSPHVP